MIQGARMCLLDGSYCTRAVGFWPWKQHEMEERLVKQNDLQTVSNRNDDNQWSPHLPSSVWRPCLFQIQRCQMSLRGLSLFKSQATQTQSKFYPEFPLFIRSICVSKSARSSQILMLAFAWFWSSISWFLTKIQMSQKQVNTDAVLYTLWFHIQGNLLAYGCYEWRHAKLIYACHFYTIF